MGIFITLLINYNLNNQMEVLILKKKYRHNKNKLNLVNPTNLPQKTRTKVSNSKYIINNIIYTHLL